MTSNNKVTKAHNNLFMKVFSEAKQAADFFTHYLPKEVVTKLDLSQLQQVPASFVDKGLKDRHADLLFEAPLQTDPNRKTLLYLLLEHQSSLDFHVNNFAKIFGQFVEGYTVSIGQCGGLS